ncbi:hypothetical protein BRC90_08000 [Halobacteriales archaeon QS_4_69_34]|nr:MAG: hypothetical protein BRC90_08000 [Halobacteriales archaeon QS_4_69_34]
MAHRPLRRWGDRLNENTRSDAVDGACEFTREMLGNLEHAVEHPDMTEDLAEILSTCTVDIEYRIETGVSVDCVGPSRLHPFVYKKLHENPGEVTGT